MGKGTPLAWQSGISCLGCEPLPRSLLVSPSLARREPAGSGKSDTANLAPCWYGHPISRWHEGMGTEARIGRSVTHLLLGIVSSAVSAASKQAAGVFMPRKVADQEGRPILTRQVLHEDGAHSCCSCREMVPASVQETCWRTQAELAAVYLLPCLSKAYVDLCWEAC